ncbi:MAG: hypothetical protein JXX29_12610 [Deltaproteobacteria bacterium]|nr:hypothetical protein [Deltaproteobacteria bacterium]MBN2672517.1 hypothetical protein [Deltaproteobacteria bacterium]
MKHCFLICTAVFWMIILAEKAHAQNSPENAESTDLNGSAPESDVSSRIALEAFNRGNVLFTEERYVDAAESFREAYQAKPSWKLWYNIGQAEAAAKHYGLGLVAFETYLSEGGDQVPPDRSREVLAAIKRLRELVGSLDVVADPGCEVFVDGVQRGTTPLDALIKLSAGTMHDVVVKKDGAELIRRSIRLSGGDERTLSVSATDASRATAPSLPVTSPETPTTAPETEGEQNHSVVSEPATDTLPPSSTSTSENTPTGNSNRLKIVGIVSLGVGAASLVVAGVTGASAIHTAKKLDEKCPNDTCSTDASVDDMYTSQAYGNVSTVLFAVGGAATAAGIILLVLNKKKQTASLRMPQATPVISNAGFGIALKGRF